MAALDTVISHGTIAQRHLGGKRLRPLPRPSTAVRALVDATASIGDRCGFVPSINFEDAVSRNTR